MSKLISLKKSKSKNSEKKYCKLIIYVSTDTKRLRNNFFWYCKFIYKQSHLNTCVWMIAINTNHLQVTLSVIYKLFINHYKSIASCFSPHPRNYFYVLYPYLSHFQKVLIKYYIL